MLNKTIPPILFLIILTLALNPALGQSFKQQFNDLVVKKDTAGQFQLLEKWEKADSQDAELYVAWYNYYVKQSMREIVTLGNNPKGKEALQIMDKDTTKKEPVGYMYSDIHYNLEVLNQGFRYIDIGIRKFPARLDMRFGKIYMYGKTEDYEKFTAEIIKTIDYSAVIKNQWTWTDNLPVEDPKKMFGGIQTYILQLYNTQNDDLLDNMKRIAETVLQYYPEHVESLSNLSIVYMLRKDYDKALVPLLKAEKLAPKDFIVLSNIAHSYKLMGDSKNAIKYYELTLLHGDDQAKKYAKKQLEELRK